MKQSDIIRIAAEAALLAIGGEASLAGYPVREKIREAYLWMRSTNFPPAEQVAEYHVAQFLGAYTSGRQEERFFAAFRAVSLALEPYYESEEDASAPEPMQGE